MEKAWGFWCSGAILTLAGNLIPGYNLVWIAGVALCVIGIIGMLRILFNQGGN